MAQPNWYRICVGCGRAHHKQELLRVVRCPDKRLEIDLHQSKPGRGAYICPNVHCALLAEKKNGFRKLHADRSFYKLLIEQVGEK